MGGMEPLDPSDRLNNRYEIIRQIGQGGMGRVYVARDWNTNGREVAVKEMRLDNVQPDGLEAAKRRFEQEAQILKNLTKKNTHPHIPQIYDFFTERDRSFLVMELIVGRTLLQVMIQNLRQQQYLPVEMVIDIGIQLCDALSYLHTQNPPVIFRDLKPENVMIRDRDGMVFLIDFGIARHFQPEKLADTQPFRSHGYTSPEAILGMGQSEPRSDLYSLGATLYHLVTSFSPRNNRPNAFTFKPASERNDRVPPSLDAFLLRLVSVDIEKRPRSAAEAGNALRAIQKEATETTSPLGQATDDEASSSFAEYQVAQAASLYLFFANLNKLPGALGGLWDKMVPFFASVGLWYRTKFAESLLLLSRAIGRSIRSIGNARRSSNSSPSNRRNARHALEPLRRHQVENRPVIPGHRGPQSTREPVHQIPRPPQRKVEHDPPNPRTREEIRDLDQHVWAPAALVAPLTRIDPVPYLGMFLTTAGISAVMLMLFHVSPINIVLTMASLLALFALLAGTSRHISTMMQNIFGLVILSMLFILIVLLAQPDEQVFVGLFTLSQLLIVLLLIGGLSLVVLKANTAYPLLRLPLLIIIPLFLGLQYVVSTSALQHSSLADLSFLFMRPFDWVHRDQAIFSLLVILVFVVLYSAFRYSTFLVARVLCSLSLAMICVVFISGWIPATQDIIDFQTYLSPGIQIFIVLGIILLFIAIVVKLPYLDNEEESHAKLAYALIELTGYVAIILTAITCLAFLNLLESNEPISRIPSNPDMDSNLQYLYILFIYIFIMCMLRIGIIFTRKRALGSSRVNRRRAYSNTTDRRLSGIYKATIDILTNDIGCMFLLLLSMMGFWLSQDIQSAQPSLYLIWSIPMLDEHTLSWIVIACVFVASIAFWFCLRRSPNGIHFGALLFCNSLCTIVLAAAVVSLLLFQTAPAWHEFLLIVTIILLSQALVVALRGEQVLQAIEKS